MKNILMTFALITGLVLTGSMNSSYADAPKAKDTPLEKSSKDAGTSLTGKVVETMDSGGYTYVNIEKDSKKTWVAIPKTEVKVGQEISFRPGGPVMYDFPSKTLGRTFKTIVFTSGIVGGAKKKAKASASEVMPSDSTHSAAVPDKKIEKINVEKADDPNAYTVAELYAKRSELDTKSIVLNGQVVKVGMAIMGKNWIHIQDGSGSASDGTDDIIVTTQDIPSVGAVVTAKGILYKDKDFGSGYKYSVIVEEASIK